MNITALTPAAPARARHRITLEAAFAAALLAFVVVRAAILLRAAWPFDTDDAFITLRYARHLASGLGIVWNPSDPVPVEGYSNFSYVLLAAAALRLGIEPLMALKVLGVASVAATGALVYLLAREWIGRIGAAVAVLVVTSYPGTAWWAVSGLETPAYQALVAGAALAFFRWRRRRESGGWLVLAGLLCFLGSTTRPEGPLVLAVLLLAVAVDAREDRRAAARGALLLVAAFALPYGAYFAWRLGQFGRLLPNSALCKAASDRNPTELVREFWGWGWQLGIVAALSAWRRLDGRHVLLLGVPLAYTAVLYRVDPIIGYEGRHFLAALALLAVAGVAGTARAAGWMYPGVPAPLREMAIAGVALLVAASGTRRAEAYLASRANGYAQRMASRRELAAWLGAHVPPTGWIAIGDAGIVPYLVRANFTDLFCLNDARATAAPGERSAQRVVDRLFATAHDAVVVHSARVDALEPRREYGVFPLVSRDERLRGGFELAARFGARQDGLAYWVFQRKPAATAVSTARSRPAKPLQGASGAAGGGTAPRPQT